MDSVIELIDLGDLATAGVRLIPLIFGLVEFSKKFKTKDGKQIVDGNWLILEAFLVGAILIGIGYATRTEMIPAAALPWVQLGINVLAGGIIGLATAGIFAWANPMIKYAKSWIKQLNGDDETEEETTEKEPDLTNGFPI